jgi:polar amino acid transport system substrate-binding protein
MEYRNDDDTPAGFDIDLMRAIADTEGFKIRFVEGSWPGFFAQQEDGGLLSTLGSGTDVVASSALITNARRVKYLVSDPYLDAGQVLAVRWDSKAATLDDLTGSTVGVIQNSRGYDVVFRDFSARRDQMRLYGSVDQALDDLLTGRIGGVVAGRVDLARGFAGNEAFKAGIRMTGPVLTDDELFGLFAAQGSDTLMAKLDDGLSKLKTSGRYDQLLDRWTLR